MLQFEFSGRVQIQMSGLAAVYTAGIKLMIRGAGGAMHRLLEYFGGTFDNFT
jgi:hypothetical protein